MDVIVVAAAVAAAAAALMLLYIDLMNVNNLFLGAGLC